MQPSCATHWRQHSVRGFFAGVVRKKLGLDLRSEKVDGDRVYRIVQVSTPTRPSAKLNLAEVSCPHGESRAEAGTERSGWRSAPPRRIGGDHDD